MINIMKLHMGRSTSAIKPFFTVFFSLSVNLFIYPQSITVTSPNGGEIWSNNSTHNITWNSSGISTVNIQYSINGGLNWITIKTGISASDKSLSWVIPDSPTGQALIKISGGNTSDQSNKYFFISSSRFNSSSPIKILPIGNSITSDNFRAEFRFAQDKISYRYKLWDLLRTDNYNIDFIGHNSGGYYVFPDPENNGIPGIKDHEIYRLLEAGYDTLNNIQVTPGNYFDSYTPDIILLHIGTNDIDNPGGTSPADVKNILDLIDTFETKSGKEIWVLLALIIDKSPPDPNVTTFNNNIKAMAQARIAAGDKIILLDMQNDAGLVYSIDNTSPYTSGDMYDDTHPNDAGKEKMAALWFKYLKLILPDPLTAPPSIISEPVATAYAALPYKYDVDASGVGAPDYSLINSPQGMTINSKTGIINWVPSSAGSFNVTVQAVNSSGNSQQSFSINVLPPPLLTNNIISYWRFDETGPPSVFEDLPGINDALCSDCPAITAGISGNALSFNGSNKVDVIDDSSMYFRKDESFTIEMWIKTDAAGEQVFLGKYGGSTSYSLGMNSGNQVKFEIRDSLGTTTNVLGPAVNDGKWHHFAGIVDRADSKLRVYVDGAGTSVNKSFHSSGFFSYEPLTLGYFKNKSFFRGSMDEVAVYNRKLLDSEITDHYNKGIVRGVGYFDPLHVQFGIFKDQNDLLVKVKPSADYNVNDKIAGIVFTIRWSSSYGIDLGDINSNYNIQKSGSEGIQDSFEFQKFEYSGNAMPLPENWSKGMEYEILRVHVIQSGTGTGTFELAPQGFPSDGTGNPFIEINSPPDETDAFSPYYRPSVNDVPIAVEFKTFYGSVSNDDVTLNWVTATEINNLGFEVERSSDNNNFISIGFVRGAGTSTEERSYTFTDYNVPAGINYYRLKQNDSDGSGIYSGTITVEVNLTPVEFKLYQNYPNPFNPSTVIKYSISSSQFVSLKIFDILGREIGTLVNGEQSAGVYQVEFNTRNFGGESLPSGVYFCQLKTEPKLNSDKGFTQTMKMVLCK